MHINALCHRALDVDVLPAEVTVIIDIPKHYSSVTNDIPKA